MCVTSHMENAQSQHLPRVEEGALVVLETLIRAIHLHLLRRFRLLFQRVRDATSVCLPCLLDRASFFL